MKPRYWCFLGLLLLVSFPVQAAHTSASLLLESAMVRPGETVIAGVRLKMDPKWHTYWKNSGDSGMATEVQWVLPPGFRAGELLWPVPVTHDDQGLITYVYYDEVVLLAPIVVPQDAPSGPVTLKAKVSWLECEVQCVPGDAEVEATLVIGPERKPGTGVEAIRTWQNRLPKSGEFLNAAFRWDGDANGSSRQAVLTWSGPESSKAEFYAYPDPAYEVRSKNADSQSLALEVRKLSDWPKEVHGVLALGEGAQRTGYEIRVQPGSASAPGTKLSAQVPLWQMLIYAFIGGLILNIMPCVLPVIALKILGFVGQARDNPKRVRAMGLIYAAGVLTSFLVLAAIVIGLKTAGQQVGWGMQFGNPVFLVALTILVTLVALNLFGLFEITPSAKVMDAAGGLASKHGASGAFFNGVLATILATPCTAPFLGAALGFAFAGTAGTILLMFSTVALGLAAPYVLLSWNPGWLRFLPKPGAWMERFKIAMGFPLMATAVWLFSLTQTHYGPRAWWLALFLVVLGLSAWIFGEFVQRRVHRGFGWTLLILALGAGYWFIMETQLRWRDPIHESETKVLASESGIPWQKWSREAVEEARRQGRPVLVDFTADWCLTCQANKKFAIEIPSVMAKLKEINAVSLLGDYTRLPADITAELQRFGRAGVPLVLVYPKEPQQPPQVLPEALTPSIVLEALETAGK